MQFSRKQYNKLCKLCILAMVISLIILMLINHLIYQNNSHNPNLPDYQHIKITAADTNTNFIDTTQVNLDETTSSYKITAAGKYILSGSMDGQIIVDAEENIVNLIFDNISVDSPEGPAINIVSAGKVIITLTESSYNTLTDSGNYKQHPEADACLYSECDLTINGEGLLNIHGYYKDAIHSKDTLKILGGDIFIQSKRDGLHGNDGIVISCPSVDIQSERNGIYSTRSGKVTKGNIEILSGAHSVIAGNYAVSCIADLFISDCNLYNIGIISDLNVGGNSFISEGSILNE